METETGTTWRTWRWVELADDRVTVWTDAAGRERLLAELALHGRLEAAGICVPRLLESSEGHAVFERARGIHGQAAFEERIFGGPVSPDLDRYAPDCPLTPWGRALARSLGTLVAHLHALEPPTSPVVADVDWERVLWVLDEHVRDPDLVREARGVAAWEATLSAPAHLVHADLHFGNLFADEEGRVTALIDLDEAGRGRAGDDLKFLPSEGPDFVREALAAYVGAGGAPIGLTEVHRFHQRSAFEHLVHIGPEQPRFPRVVQWIRGATSAVRSVRDLG
ncbi:MAG: phosphotransferase [Alphaproteobacteria bacterium]|nr:phosphotransferase [Alphaproteobacteria bacterium]